MTRLQQTGLEPVRLTIQYRMHQDISESPCKHIYTKANPATGERELVLFNHESTRNRSQRANVLRWMSTYLENPIESTKSSMFAAVEDSICLQQKMGLNERETSGYSRDFYDSQP
ncbi:hypothetical protein QC760_008844 [Botrytis cinerea]